MVVFIALFSVAWCSLTFHPSSDSLEDCRAGKIIDQQQFNTCHVTICRVSAKRFTWARRRKNTINKTKQDKKTHKTEWPKKNMTSALCSRNLILANKITCGVIYHYYIYIYSSIYIYIVPSTSTPASYFASGVADHLRPRTQIIFKFRRNILRDKGNFEHQNKILESSIFIINYCIIIIHAYYNCIIDV